jgi:hypothetical protein
MPAESGLYFIESCFHSNAAAAMLAAAIADHVQELDCRGKPYIQCTLQVNTLTCLMTITLMHYLHARVLKRKMLSCRVWLSFTQQLLLSAVCYALSS